MDRDRNPVRDCEMRNEFGRAFDPAGKGIALDHERNRAPARADAARTNGRDFDRRRNAADRQPAFDRARSAPSSSTGARSDDSFRKTPAERSFFHGPLREE